MILKALSLFSGAGGMDIGVSRAGFRNLCSVEFDPHCASTLRRNAPQSSVWQVEVRALDPARAADALGFRPGDLALLHGGPPCQPFSQIESRKGLEDPRGRLAFEMVRFAEALRPAAVVIEQVPAFLTTAAADGMTFFDVLREEFCKVDDISPNRGVGIRAGNHYIAIEGYKTRQVRCAARTPWDTFPSSWTGLRSIGAGERTGSCTGTRSRPGKETRREA